MNLVIGKDNPFPTNMLQNQEGLASATKDDLVGIKTVAEPIKDTVQPMEVIPELANSVVVRVGDVECSAGQKNPHVWTYKPKADVADGKWRDDHKDSWPRHVPKPAVTFDQLLAKYERLGRANRCRAEQRRIADTGRTGNTPRPPD